MHKNIVIVDRRLSRAQKRLVASLCAVVLALAVWAPRVALAADIIHVVQPGENLYRIGLQYGVGWQTIMAANGLYNTYIHVGQSLVIPGAAGSAVAVTPPPAPTPPPVAAPPAASSEVYIVQRGDALWLIAQRYQTSVSELIALNSLANPNLIYAGQALTVAGQPEAPGKLLAVTGRNQALPLDCEIRSAVDKGPLTLARRWTSSSSSAGCRCRMTPMPVSWAMCAGTGDKSPRPRTACTQAPLPRCCAATACKPAPSAA